MESSDDTEILARFSSRLEGEFAVETLRAGGVEAILLADDAGGALPGMLFQRVRVLVRRGDVERAREILGGEEEPG
jgi:hypothetical protein